MVQQKGGKWDKVRFWKNPWLLNDSLLHAFPRLFRMANSKDLVIAQCWSENRRGWDLSPKKWAVLSNTLADFALTNCEDLKFWTLESSRVFSVESRMPKLMNHQVLMPPNIGNATWQLKLPRFSSGSFLRRGLRRASGFRN